MLKGSTARRYAEAAFQIGDEQRTLERWQSDVHLIAEYFGNHQLAFILGEPNVQFERKEGMVRDLLEGKVQTDALGLALLMVERQNVDLAKRVSDEFDRRYDAYLGQTHAEFVTAAPLDDAMRERVKADLQQRTGKRIILHERVDPSILGGAIARVGDTLIDGSVRRKLQVLRQHIQRGGAFGGPDDGVGDAGLGADLPGGPTGGAPMSAPGADAPATSGDGATPQAGTPPTGPSDMRPDGAMNMASRQGPHAHLAPKPASVQSAGNAPERTSPKGDDRRMGRDKRRRR